MTEVDPAGVRARAHPEVVGNAAVSLERGPDHSDRRATVPEVLLEPEHPVVGERLDGLRVFTPDTRGDRGGLFCRDRVQGPDGPSIRGLPGELPRSEDRGLIVDFRVSAIGVGLTLRRTTHSPGVEERLEGTVSVTHTDAEVEDARSLDEEGSSLREERLLGREVHLGGVGFHLPEVRIDGHVECEVRRNAVLEVQADGAERGGRAVVGVLFVSG